MRGSDGARQSYVRVSPDLLKDVVVKVAGVALELVGDVEGVLEAVVELVQEGGLGALLQVHLG